jgi:hypothetical protein
MLTKTVTKVFPTENTVGLHLTLKDDDVVVIDRDFVKNYAAGEDVPNDVRDAIGQEMQAEIDKYKILKSRFDSAKYETVRTQVDNNLNL